MKFTCFISASPFIYLIVNMKLVYAGILNFAVVRS